MDAAEREVLEREVRGLLDGGDATAAANRAIRGYGAEVLGFLTAHQKNESDADDVFAIWAERLWRGLAGFGWDCSLRTWVYAVARNASRNFTRDRKVQARRQAPLPDSEALAVAAEVRSDTRSFLRTEAKDRLTEIRDALPEEDRALLVLRIDRRLEWKDLARVMLEDGAAADDATLARESQRLRKRFQHLKERLVEAGRREGLVRGR
jgi:RNA polymerase sigma-70 factor (ECF subfamily)